MERITTEVTEYHRGITITERASVFLCDTLGSNKLSQSLAFRFSFQDSRRFYRAIKRVENRGLIGEINLGWIVDVYWCSPTPARRDIFYTR
jgi:hypothetical protein